MKIIFKNSYRIITDNYNGYEVQIRRWFFPFWVQIGEQGFTNTNPSIESAKQLIQRHKKGFVVAPPTEVWSENE